MKKKITLTIAFNRMTMNTFSTTTLILLPLVYSATALPWLLLPIEKKGLIVFDQLNNLGNETVKFIKKSIRKLEDPFLGNRSRGFITLSECCKQKDNLLTQRQINWQRFIDMSYQITLLGRNSETLAQHNSECKKGQNEIPSSR